VRNFDILANLLWEGLKNPKDNPCWKGYKPVGTKKKNGRTVPNCVPKESKKKLTESFAYKLSSSFTDLPDSPPHGFWVTKDGKFIVVPYMWGHDEAINTLYPQVAAGSMGSRLQMNALKAGLVRMAKIGNTYGLTYHPTYSGKTATKTARDIASFYNMGVQDDFEGL
jgi:hypothetical protein